MAWKDWALMNQMNTKVDSNGKRIKINKSILEKIVLGKVRGDQFLYISLMLDYRINSW